MPKNNLRLDYSRVLILCCFGCFLIGAGVVYPIYYYSNYTVVYPYVDNQYSEVKSYSGTVSESDPEFVVSFTPPFYSVFQRVEIRNFYTNSTPVTLILVTPHSNKTVSNFYNQTVEPINHEFMIYAYDFSFVIQFNGSAATFSFWFFILNQPFPPSIAPPDPWALYIGGFFFFYRSRDSQLWIVQVSNAKTIFSFTTLWSGFDILQSWDPSPQLELSLVFQTSLLSSLS